MNARKRLTAASLGLAMMVLPVTAAGLAHAAEPGESGAATPEESFGPADSTLDTPETPGESTQSPLQAAGSLGSIIGANSFGLMDALNGDNRPDGANGVERELLTPDPRYVEGPVGGLVKNGPQQ